MKYSDSNKNGKFKGKTLLVLGSDVGAADMVVYARNNGAHTIVVDNSPYERYKAKREADEHALISTNDINALVKFGREKKVDGVVAGISEFNLLNAYEVSKQLGLPFLFSLEQWEKIEHKSQFRKMCTEFGVPCPKLFYTGKQVMSCEEELVTFPVMIKPVDASSSKGVFACNNYEELIRYQEEALKESKKGEIIIEELVEGIEFTAHYTIINNKATLACVDNRHSVKLREEDPTSIPIIRTYPFKHLEEYLCKVNEPMVQLCESIGLGNGILFVQGMFNEKSGKFYIFEAGLRSAGEAPYRFIKIVNGINAINILVDHVLLGTTEEDQERDDPRLNGKICGIISFATRGGTVGRILGLEETIERLDSIVEYENRYPVGSTAPTGRTLRQLLMRFIVVCNDEIEMKDSIKYIYDHVEVLNSEGESMIVKPE